VCFDISKIKIYLNTVESTPAVSSKPLGHLEKPVAARLLEMIR